jgi:hypothetical protein
MIAVSGTRCKCRGASDAMLAMLANWRMRSAPKFANQIRGRLRTDAVSVFRLMPVAPIADNSFLSPVRVPSEFG